MVVNRGKWVTMAGFFNYVYENVDDATVGKLLSTTHLGYYQMAYRIFSLPVSEVSDVVNRVVFPVFVKISDDRVRLKRAYLKSLVFASFLVLPLSVILLSFPDLIVKIVLGESWLPIVPLIRIMAFFGVTRFIAKSSFSLFLAVKKQEYVTATTLIGLVSMVITIIPFVKMWGIVGAGLSALVGSIVTIPVVWYYFRKI
jgi:O-antigen/teichoic acid export membrane protein